MQEMQDFLRGRAIRTQAIPEQLEFIDVMPRNPSGKITKNVLRERYGGSAMSARALDDVTSSLGYGVYDADTHYYEPYDAFTRHIDPEFRDRAVHSRPDARAVNARGSATSRCASSPCTPKTSSARPARCATCSSTPTSPPPATRSVPRRCRAATFPRSWTATPRLAFMDEQGIAASLVFPSVGVTVEHEMRHDPPAAMANFVAFNKWLEEDWGLHGRIIGVPLLSLLDIDLAVIELDRVLARGARAVYLRPSPVYGRSPVDPVFDPFWSRIDEAGIPVVMHNSQHELQRARLGALGRRPAPKVSDISPLQWYLGMTDRPIADMLAALVLHNLFGRFPNVEVLSIENGCAWLAPLLAQLDHAVALAATAAGSAARSTTCRATSSRRSSRCRRSPRKTRSRWPAPSGSSGCCSAPTGRIPKVSSARSTSPTSSRRSTTTASAP